ncbi:MAG TPA: carboxypeptidase-like regulatory domain-containing protein, partial [Vicinamibacterales bacterium]|nr:carboxypeptidase-like regulatory domain-containing protein [Vicinamibacterales bacterium]
VANAQVVGGHISGLITDEVGKPVCDVYVTAHGTDQSQVMKTDASGEFRLHDLVPGRYVLTVARDGFTTIVHSGIMVRAGKNARLPLVMKVASNWATPIVEAADPFALMPPSSLMPVDLIAKNTPPRRRR